MMRPETDPAVFGLRDGTNYRHKCPSILKKSSHRDNHRGNSSSNGNTGSIKEEIVSGSSQSSSAEGRDNVNNTSQSRRVVVEQEHSPKIATGKIRFNALLSKFGGGGNRENQPIDVANGDGGDGREEPFAVIAPQPSVISADKKALSQWRTRYNDMLPSTKKPAPVNNATDETPPPPSPNEHSNGSSPSNSGKIPTFLVKARQSINSSLESSSSRSQSQSHQQKQSQQQLQQSREPQPHSRPRQQTKSKSQLTHHQKQNGNRNTNNHTKSHQRLVVEQVAAQYFLNDAQQCDNNYAGVTDYGSISMDSAGGGERLMNTIENTYDSTGSEDGNRSSNSQSRASSDNQWSRNNKDREEVLLFLDIDEAVTSKKKSATELSQEIQRETNIDAILEMASDHLSLGRNDLALTAYRRAMKITFEDVVSVKQTLLEVKQKQQQPNDEELTFELSLLQVAGRVADIHFNIGVVHEMSRQYEKAKSSYVDALEVYHNTCKRFEEKGDIDVDRTWKNVERMAAACSSEQERRELHAKARRTVKRVEQEQHFASRRTLLREAIGTLQETLELEGSTIGLSHPVAASTLIQIGKYHYEIREYDAAVRAIRRAILILKSAFGGNHPKVGTSTLLLVNIYERHGESISSEGTSIEKNNLELELYLDALKPLKATLGEVHQEVACLYQKIANLYGRRGDLSLSLLAYKAALKAHGEPSSATLAGESIHQDIIAVWVRVTEHLTSLRLWDQALVAGRRALFLLRRCKNALFQVASSSPSSSTSSQTQSSKTSLMEITSDTYYDCLFSTLQCVGQAHTSLSDFALAQDACSESLRVAWEMTLSSCQNTGSSPKHELQTNVQKVIRALKRLGKTHLLSKDYTSALECFLPSLELLRSSKETQTIDTASVLGSLGYLYLKLKKYTESSNFFRECLRLYERNGVDTNDRETRKIVSWLEVAESKEKEDSVPPILLEIPVFLFQDKT